MIKHETFPSRGKTRKENGKETFKKKVKLNTEIKDFWGGVTDITLNITLMALLTVLVTQAVVYAADVYAGAASYQYLTDSVFGDYSGSQSPEAQFFLSIMSKILKWVLPFMNVFAIGMMVVSFASTIIYLSRPDVFDDVHMLKVVKRKIKGKQNIKEKYLELWKEADGVWDFIKMMIVPDFKALAFYDAGDIGQDGRPSMMTFFKYKMPKYIAVVAMLMCVNDQTLIKFLSSTGNAGAFIVRQAADYNYAAMAKSLIDSGADYNPGYRTVGASRADKNKRMIWNAIYSQMKQNNGFNPDRRTKEYLSAMGSQIESWVNNEIATNVNLDGEKMSVNVTVQPNAPQGDASNGIFTKSLSALQPGTDSGHVTVIVGFGQSARGLSYHDTTFADAWTDSNGTELTLDIMKVGAVKSAVGNTENIKVTATATLQYITGLTDVNQTPNKTNREESGPGVVEVNGNTIKITSPAGKNVILGANIVFNITGAKGNMIVQNEVVYYKNPAFDTLQGKLRQAQNSTNNK